MNLANATGGYGFFLLTRRLMSRLLTSNCHALLPHELRLYSSFLYRFCEVLFVLSLKVIRAVLVFLVNKRLNKLRRLGFKAMCNFFSVF